MPTYFQDHILDASFSGTGGRPSPTYTPATLLFVPGTLMGNKFFYIAALLVELTSSESLSTITAPATVVKSTPN